MIIKEITKPNHLRANSKKPKMVKPNKGHMSPNVNRGKLVGEGDLVKGNFPDKKPRQSELPFDYDQSGNDINTAPLEKVKYELSDIIDQKFENITRNLDTQTSTLKETYDKLCGDIGKMSTELNKSFKDKAHTLKSMCATFFAKIDTQVTDNIRKVDKIQISHDNFEANFINPAKEVDAKVFSMKE